MLSGTLPLFGYEGLVFWPVCALFTLGIYLVRPAWKTEMIRDVALGLLAACLPITVLGCYQSLAWGRPWSTFGPFQNPAYQGNLSLAQTFSGPFWQNLYLLLFNFPGTVYPRGLFMLQPILFCSIIGWAIWLRTKPVPAVLLVAYIAPIFSFFAKYWAPHGGSSGDPRYVIPALGCCFIPLAGWLDLTLS